MEDDIDVEAVIAKLREQGKLAALQAYIAIAEDTRIPLILRLKASDRAEALILAADKEVPKYKWVNGAKVRITQRRSP